MIKWMILGIKEPCKWFPFNIVIHKIPTNDIEDHKHNHPFSLCKKKKNNNIKRWLLGTPRQW